jgi:short-subunit dehydrogenase/ferritin-like metal-binding protein YciE
MRGLNQIFGAQCFHPRRHRPLSAAADKKPHDSSVVNGSARENWHVQSGDSPMKPETVLITGASSGIGLELARQFAQAGHQLVITAPVQAELDQIAEEFSSQYNVMVHPIAVDLLNASAASTLLSTVKEAGLEITILVNNAGVGMRGNFADIPIERDLEMIRLNAEAVVRITKTFLPLMITRGSGRLFFTASIAGFEPGPLLAVYHATKAFVLSLSQALATELEDTGITVTALCPGPVDTDFFPKAEMVETRAFQKANVMAPQEVAKAGYEAAMRGERIVVPGGMNKTTVFARRFLSEPAQAKMNEKYYEEVKPEDHKREPGEIAAKHAASPDRKSVVAPDRPTHKDSSGVHSMKELLVEELRDLLDAEKQLTKALPKMAKAASNEALKQGFADHLEETKLHVERLKHAFEILGEKAAGKTCHAMKGLIEEGNEAISTRGPQSLRDARLIGAAQRVEHYEIAAYGTARAFATSLGLTEVVSLLQQTLDEEGAADKKLTALGTSINEYALAASPLEGN